MAGSCTDAGLFIFGWLAEHSKAPGLNPEIPLIRTQVEILHHPPDCSNPPRAKRVVIHHGSRVLPQGDSESLQRRKHGMRRYGWLTESSQGTTLEA